MDFLGIGPMEIILILVLAVLVWGPGRIVEIGRTLGRTVRAIRKATSEISVQFTRELEEEKKQLNQNKPENPPSEKLV
jgi:TatA/E family protein of Tat protein translocase